MSTVKSAAVRQSYGEAKIYAGLLGGFALCLCLSTVILPAIGLGTFARQFEEYVDKAAPCLLSPVVAWLVAGLRSRGQLAFVTGLVGGVAFLFWFFVIFELPMALAGLALLGAGVALGYRAHRRSRHWPGLHEG